VPVCQVEFPSAVPKVAAHLILRLLEKVEPGAQLEPQCWCAAWVFLMGRSGLLQDLSKRFGNLREGPSDVKKHRFFQGVDWGQLAARKFVAGGNLKPNLSGEGDMSRFAGSVDTAAQPALDESLATMIPRAQQALFKDWQ
jgi:protein kinase A